MYNIEYYNTHFKRCGDIINNTINIIQVEGSVKIVVNTVLI